MKTPYDQSLQRLKSRRSDNPEYAMATRQLAEMSTDLNYAQQSINARLGRQGESINAQIGAMIAQNQSIGSIYNKVYGQAQDAQAQRTGQIDNQILQVEGQRDAYEFQKNEQNKANKQGLLKTAIGLGGTILGGGIGALTGIGVLPGAGLGSSLANIVANSGAISGTGQADPAAILQSVGDATQQVSGWMSTKYNKKISGDVAEFLKGGTESYVDTEEPSLSVSGQSETGTLPSGMTLDAGNTPGVTTTQGLSTRMTGFSALSLQQQQMFKFLLETKNYEAAYAIMGKKLPPNHWSGEF
jgi:hypothetical protein